MLFVFAFETDLVTFGRWLRGHNLSDGVEYDLELGVIFIFQSGESSCEFFVRRQHLAEANEGAHDFNIDLDRAFATQGTLFDTCFLPTVKNRNAPLILEAG